MSGIAGVIYRDWRQRITNVGFVFWDLLVPAAYLVLFGTGFDYALARSFVVDGREIVYVLPAPRSDRNDRFQRGHEHRLGLFHGQGLRDLLRDLDLSNDVAAVFNRQSLLQRDGEFDRRAADDLARRLGDGRAGALGLGAVDCLGDRRDHCGVVFSAEHLRHPLAAAPAYPGKRRKSSGSIHPRSRVGAGLPCFSASRFSCLPSVER
jgi:hypothetical protein